MKSGALITASVLAIAACKTQGDIGPEPSARVASAPPASVHKLRVREAPGEGDVQALVRGALERAIKEDRRLVVYVGATWCEPCQRFHKAAERGELDVSFPEVDLLSFDLDRDGDRLKAAGYASRLIPLFALPGPDGRASGKQVEGGIKGDGAVAYMAPRLRQMLEE